VELKGEEKKRFPSPFFKTFLICYLVKENMANNTLHSNSNLSFIRRFIYQNKVGYLFILPALLLYAIFFIYPFIGTFYFSLTNWNGVSRKRHLLDLIITLE